MDLYAIFKKASYCSSVNLEEDAAEWLERLVTAAKESPLTGTLQQAFEKEGHGTNEAKMELIAHEVLFLASAEACIQDKSDIGIRHMIRVILDDNELYNHLGPFFVLAPEDMEKRVRAMQDTLSKMVGFLARPLEDPYIRHLSSNERWKILEKASRDAIQAIHKTDQQWNEQVPILFSTRLRE